MAELEKVTKSNLPAHLRQFGGPGRKKGIPSRFTLQRQEFFKACKDGKLFAWVQEILNGKDNRMKMEVLRVWASLQPKEVRAELEGMTGPSVIIIRADGTNTSKEPASGNKVIDIEGGKSNA